MGPASSLFVETAQDTNHLHTVLGVEGGHTSPSVFILAERSLLFGLHKGLGTFGCQAAVRAGTRAEARGGAVTISLSLSFALWLAEWVTSWMASARKFIAFTLFFLIFFRPFLMLFLAKLMLLKNLELKHLRDLYLCDLRFFNGMSMLFLCLCVVSFLALSAW